MANLNEYLSQRSTFLNEEKSRYLGSQLSLTEKEQKVNDILMHAKATEIEKGFQNPKVYLSAQHMFEVLSEVEASKVFKIIRKLPKGGILHSHDTALLSVDKIIKFTYRENLWISGDVFDALPKLIFSNKKPIEVDPNMPWKLIQEVRAKHGAVEFDTALRRHFTLFCSHPVCTYRDIDTVWAKFMSLFAAIEPIILYSEIWMEYFYNALKEILDDGVQYLEFRGLLPHVSKTISTCTVKP